MEGFITTADGLRLYYRIIGSGPEPVVIPAAAWLAVEFEALAAGRTLIFYDARGRGQSDPVTDAAQVASGYEVDDLAAICGHFGLSRVSLIGWSAMSGSMAQYALAHPAAIDRLLLIGPGPVWGEGMYRYPEEAQKRAEARTDPAAVQRLAELREAGMDMSDPVAYCREYQQVWLPRQMGQPDALAQMRANPCAYENEWPRNLLALWQKLPPPGAWDWRPQLASLAVPTLIIHGAEDLIPLASSQEWAATLPQARLLVIPGSGHYPWIEAPDHFFPAADRFLRGDWPEGAAPIPAVA